MKTPKIKKTRHRVLDTNMEAKGYVSVASAVNILGMSLTGVHQMCNDGKLDHIRVGGQPDGKMARVFIRRESLKNHLGPEAARVLKVF